MTINVGLLITYIISILVMVGLPVALAVFLTKKFNVSWWVILAGVLTFIGSQALRIPAAAGLNTLFQNGTIPVPPTAWIPILNGVIAGFMAGFFEESARWIGFKILRKRAKPYTSALGLGVGHGGIESIIFGIVGTGVTLVTVLFFNAGAQIAKGVSTSQVSGMLAQISQFWSAPWHYGLLPGVERVIALSTQILLSILVWKAVVNRQVLWLLLAILYHTVVDAVAVYLSQIGWGYWAVEGLLALFMIINIYLIYTFWKDEKELAEMKAEEGDVDDDEDDDGDEDDEDDDDYDEDDEELEPDEDEEPVVKSK